MVFVSVESIYRDFGKKQKRIFALDNISFQINKGESISLLGQNGAGKTTLSKILCGSLLPSSGRVIIDGFSTEKNVKDIQRIVSVVFGGEHGLFGNLNAFDNMRYFGALKGLSGSAHEDKCRWLLKEMGIGDISRPVETFSKGMKQRLHLAIAWQSLPELLVLDEPTIGLDTAERDHVYEMISEINNKGVTVVLTSHDERDIEKLTNRVLLIDNGKLILDDSIQNFKNKYSGDLSLKFILRNRRTGDLKSFDSDVKSLITQISGLSEDFLDQYEIIDSKMSEDALESAIRRVYSEKF